MTGELDIVRTIIGWLLIGSGGFFLVVGALGINRMPDVFTRLHAASVGDTFGAGLMLVGMMVVAGLSLVTVKLLFLFLFLWFIAPVTTHAIARAALQSGIAPKLSDQGGDGMTSPAKGEGAPSRR
jgi:multicomponent Na+:H+ antiporter subunit G